MLSKLLLSSSLLIAMAASAVAADLPSEKGPPVYAPPPPPAFSWTGVYIGGQVGYNWSSRTSFFDNTFGVPLNGLSQSGVIGGGHVGANYELGSLGSFIPVFGGTVAASSSASKAMSTVRRAMTALSIRLTGSIRFAKTKTSRSAAALASPLIAC